MSPLVIHGRGVFTFGSAPRVFAPGAVRIEGGRVTHVGPVDEVPAEGARTIDAEDHFLLPGLANAHTHLYSSLARGLPVSGPAPASFREILERVWWRWDKGLDEDAVRLNALAGLLEAIRAGVTVVNDHHASPFAVEESLDALASAAEAIGVRVALAYEVSDRDGVAIRDRGLAENERFARRLEERPSPLLASSIGAHASFTLGDESLARLADLARRTGRPLHLHLDEGPEDGEDARRRGARSTVARLDEAGILRPGTVVAHAVHVDDEDVALLAARGVFVAHNPLSNGGNAVGRARVPALLRAGVEVGLGTDGMSGSLAGDAAAAGAAHRMAEKDRSIPFDLPAKLVGEGNARLASRLFGGTFGALEPGAAGDVVAVRYDPPSPVTAANAAAHWQLGLLHAPVEHVVVAGEPTLVEGRFVKVDEEEILARARVAAARLWENM